MVVTPADGSLSEGLFTVTHKLINSNYCIFLFYCYLKILKSAALFKGPRFTFTVSYWRRMSVSVPAGRDSVSVDPACSVQVWCTLLGAIINCKKDKKSCVRDSCEFRILFGIVPELYFHYYLFHHIFMFTVTSNLIPACRIRVVTVVCVWVSSSH